MCVRSIDVWNCSLLYITVLPQGQPWPLLQRIDATDCLIVEVKGFEAVAVN